MPLAHGLQLSLVLCPRSFRMGFEPLSEASLRALQLPARSFLVVLAEAASLLEVLAISIVLPWPMVRLRDHLHYPWSRLPVVIWAWPYILLDGLTGGPHCGRESSRVLSSLLGSSLSGVRHLSRVCSSVWGPVGVAHPFHPSLLLGGALVRFCGGPYWRSLTMSWACHLPFLCFGLVCRSRSQCRPSSAVSSLTVSVLCVRSLLRGTSLHALGSVGAHGVRSGSTYIALHRSWSVSAILTYATWSSGRCFLLFLRNIQHVFMAINLSVYLTYTCTRLNNPVGLCYLDTCRAEWLGWLRVPLLALPGLCRLRWIMVSTACSWGIQR